MSMNQLDGITAAAHDYFSIQNRARERALPLCRQMIQNSGNAIRSAHRLQPDRAHELLAQNADVNRQLLEAVADSEEIRQAGFVHDAQKEYAEACITVALIESRPLPRAEEIGVSMPAYLIAFSLVATMTGAFSDSDVLMIAWVISRFEVLNAPTA